jgi:hypothetical protein
LLKIPQVQGCAGVATITARAHAPQKRQAPLGLVTAVGPTGSHHAMLRLLCFRAAAPFHIPRTGSRRTCDVVRSLPLLPVLDQRPAALRRSP